MLKEAHKQETKRKYLEKIKTIEEARAKKFSSPQYPSANPSQNNNFISPNRKLEIISEHGSPLYETNSNNTLSKIPVSLIPRPYISESPEPQSYKFERQESIFPWLSPEKTISEEMQKKKNWVETLNKQAEDKLKAKKALAADKLRKEAMEEAKVRNQLEELREKYRKELSFETGEYESQSFDHSAPTLKFRMHKAGENATYDKLSYSNPEIHAYNEKKKASNNVFQLNELDRDRDINIKINEKNKLNLIRSDVSDLIKGLKMQAKAAQTENKQLYRGIGMDMSQIYSDPGINLPGIRNSRPVNIFHPYKRY